MTPDVAKAVTEIKGGKIEFRTDRHGNLHFIIGKASFPSNALLENYAAALDEVIRLKPAAAKGRYLKKVTFTTTMGPGIPVDPNKTRNFTEERPKPRPDPTREAAGPDPGTRPLLPAPSGPPLPAATPGQQGVGGSPATQEGGPWATDPNRGTHGRSSQRVDGASGP